MTQALKPARGLVPPLVATGLWAAIGFAVTSAAMLWLERGPAILLDLAPLSVRFICF